MSAVPQKPARVTLSGDINGHYVVRQRRRGGQLVLDPDVSAEEIREGVGARKATSAEFGRFISEHEGELAPGDDEG